MQHGQMDGQHDRRVQRSKHLLRRALADLITEKPFDKITVQEIIDRANVGRTTFYAHYQSKEDLFLSGHDGIIGIIIRSFISHEGTLCDEPSSELIAFLNEVSSQRHDAYFYLTWGSDTREIIRLLKDRIAEHLAARLHEVFHEEESTVPFMILAQHIAGSMIALVTWWMDKRIAYSAQEMVSMLHRLNSVTLRHALGQQAAKHNPGSA